jgi:hypothetical protein
MGEGWVGVDVVQGKALFGNATPPPALPIKRREHLKLAPSLKKR